MNKKEIMNKLIQMQEDSAMKNNARFDMFMSDLEKAIAFYKSAITNINRQTRGEDERKADRFVRLLCGPAGLNVNIGKRTGMQVMAIFAEMEDEIKLLVA